MNEQEEAAYELGKSQVWLGIFYSAVRELGQNRNIDQARWIGERIEIEAAIRQLWRKRMDVPFPDGVYLPDVIQEIIKHLD